MKRKSEKIASAANDKERPKAQQNSVSPHLPYVVAGITALFALVLYLPALRNGFVSWDDELYVVNNFFIRSLNWDFFRWAFSDYKTILWHPVAWISHALDYALWGLDPFGHHLTSIILHAVNTGTVVLLTITLLRSVNDRRRDAGDQILDEHALTIAAGATALLFGIHPLRVESVAWIAERKDLLYSLFFMLSIVSYLRYASVAAAGDRKRHYLYSLLLFLLSVCSKPMAVTLPAVLLLLDWYPLNRLSNETNKTRLFLEKIPFIGLSIFITVLSVIAQMNASGLVMMQKTPLAVRFIVAFKAYIHYLWKMLAPLHLLPFYPFPRHVVFTDPEYLGAIIVFIVASAFCVYRMKKQPFWLAAWAYFVITLSPVIGIVQVGRQYAADRFAYLSTLGFLVLLGSGAALLWQKTNARRYKGWRLLLGGVMSVVVVVFSYATVNQITVWKNELQLWNHVIENIPQDNPWAYMFRGLALENEGKVGDAISNYTTAIVQDPGHVEALVTRGAAFCRTGQLDRALDDFDKAISLRPDEYVAYNNRGNAFYQKGDVKRARADFDTAIRLHPYESLAYNNRGAVFAKQGENQKAIEDFTKAIVQSPNYGDAYYNRGTLFAKLGKFDDAVRDFDHVIKLQPEWPQGYLDRGDCFLRSGNKARAAVDYQTACAMGDERGCKKVETASR